MEIPQDKRSFPQDSAAVRKGSRKQGRLSCGSQVCLHCHAGCGVAMEAYLRGLDENQEIREEDL